MEYWDKMTWCCLKHLLKSRGNCKEALDKAVRDGGDFSPEGGTLRNYLLSIENLECAVGHYEEFLSMALSEKSDKVDKKNAKVFSELLDATRLVRQEMVNVAGEPADKLARCLKKIDNLIDYQTKYMRGEEIEELVEGENENED